MMVANAQGGFTVDGINYTVTSDKELTVEVGDNKNYSGDVKIPATVQKPRSSKSYSVTGIGEEAFWCSNLTSIEIPASVTTIDKEAFHGCSSLSSVTFVEGSKLSVIGCQAFYDCTTLSSIIIPASVTSIGSQAFYNCKSLSSVTFAEGSKLNTIGENAFGRTALTSIEIPASVTTIDGYVFYESYNLASVTVHWTESLPSMSKYAFNGINTDAVLNVPFGTMAMYSAADAFKKFKSIKSPDFKLGVSSAGWASMYLPCAVTIPSGAEVYYASAVSGSTITLSKVEGILPAETGVIVKAAAGTVEFAETAEAGTSIDVNLFKGLLADADFSYRVYVLSGASAEGTPLFQEYEGGKLNAFKAYLPMSAVSGVDEIKFRFDEATGIESLTPALSEGERAIYNLNGVRVDGSYRGIVIRNGKKMFNK